MDLTWAQVLQRVSWAASSCPGSVASFEGELLTVCGDKRRVKGSRRDGTVECDFLVTFLSNMNTHTVNRSTYPEWDENEREKGCVDFVTVVVAGNVNGGVGWRVINDGVSG